MANSIRVSDLPDYSTVGNGTFKDSDVFLLASNGTSYQVSFGYLYNAIEEKIHDAVFSWLNKVAVINSIAELRTASGGDTTQLTAVGYKAGKEMISWMDNLSANLSCARWS